jgi:hypothetical protein
LRVYHVEIRQFPHNAWRFNLADADLPPILFPWVREHAVDFGERKWSPHTASITILEGPQLEVQQLTMGRGWQAAQRVGEDVTERLLEWAKATDAKAAAEHAGAERAAEVAEAAEIAATPAGAQLEPEDRSARGASTASGAMSDPLALGAQIAALLGPEPSRLLEAWRAVVSAAPDLSPSDALARAEAQLRSS